MNILDSIDKKELKELLGKGWITHDGMWFLHCFRNLGIDRTNALNRAAIASLAMFEVERMREVMGFDDREIKTFEDLKIFFEGAIDLVIPNFMRFKIEYPERNVMLWEWEKEQCFAYKGLKRIGALENYRCGVMYRIDRWFDCLKIRYTSEKIERCRMHTHGECKGEYRFLLD